MPLYGLRNPLAMIGSYPPAIVARAEELGLVLCERKQRALKVITAKLAFCLITAIALAVILCIFNKCGLLSVVLSMATQFEPMWPHPSTFFVLCCPTSIVFLHNLDSPYPSAALAKFGLFCYTDPISAPALGRWAPG